MNEAQLRQLLAQFVGRSMPSILATVKAVNEDDATCDLDDDGTMHYNVRLRPITGANDGVLLVPGIGAKALAIQIESTDDWMVLQCTKYDKFLASIGGVTIDIAEGAILLNGGENGGLVLVNAILDAINRLEDKLKSHQHAYIPYPSGSPGSPVPTTGGETATPPSFVLEFQNTTLGDIENTAIKQ